MNFLHDKRRRKESGNGRGPLRQRRKLCGLYGVNPLSPAAGTSLLPAPPLPQEAGAAAAACRPAPTREKGVLKSPQAFQNPKISNIFSAETAQSNAEGILNRPPPLPRSGVTVRVHRRRHGCRRRPFHRRSCRRSCYRRTNRPQRSRRQSRRPWEDGADADCCSGAGGAGHCGNRGHSPGRIRGQSRGPEEEAGRDDNADGGPSLPCSPMRRGPSSSPLHGRWVQ